MTTLELASQAQKHLIDITKELKTPALRTACYAVLYHPNFTTQFGSAGQHHAYEGGLVIHTHEVTQYALGMAAMLSTPDLDKDALVTAAIYHDFFKVKEYVPSAGPLGVVPSKTLYRNLVRHVAGSHAAFMKEVDGQGLPDLQLVKIEHAILAHHGRFEWGSPVEPQTVEAYILHCADMFSVRFGDGAGRR